MTVALTDLILKQSPLFPVGETEPERVEAICQTSHNDSMSRLKKDILFSDSCQVLYPLDYTISTLEIYLLIPAQELCSSYCAFK